MLRIQLEIAELENALQTIESNRIAAEATFNSLLNRDQLAIRLTALGLQAVRIDTPHEAPELTPTN